MSDLHLEIIKSLNLWEKIYLKKNYMWCPYLWMVLFIYLYLYRSTFYIAVNKVYNLFHCIVVLPINWLFTLFYCSIAYKLPCFRLSFVDNCIVHDYIFYFLFFNKKILLN